MIFLVYGEFLVTKIEGDQKRKPINYNFTRFYVQIGVFLNYRYQPHSLVTIPVLSKRNYSLNGFRCPTQICIFIWKYWISYKQDTVLSLSKVSPSMSSQTRPGRWQWAPRTFPDPCCPWRRYRSWSTQCWGGCCGWRRTSVSSAGDNRGTFVSYCTAVLRIRNDLFRIQIQL